MVKTRRRRIFYNTRRGEKRRRVKEKKGEKSVREEKKWHQVLRTVLSMFLWIKTGAEAGAWKLCAGPLLVANSRDESDLNVETQ